MTVNFTFPSLPPSTIVPEDWKLYIPYFNRTYEDISYIVNLKDNIFYPMPITNTATNILGLPNFGSFVVCISGIAPGLPCLTVALNKASPTSTGVVNVLGSQAGNAAPWIGATLTVTSTAGAFQVKHSVANQTGSFNIKTIGTQ